MATTPPTPPLDPVTVSIALFAAWLGLGPALAQVIGTYFVIILSAGAGAGWALMRREQKGTLAAVAFVTLLIVTSTLTTVAIALIINSFLKFGETAQNFLLPPVALLISGVGQDWAKVVPWLADKIFHFIITLKGGTYTADSAIKEDPKPADDEENTGATP